MKLIFILDPCMLVAGLASQVRLGSGATAHWVAATVAAHSAAGAIVVGLHGDGGFGHVSAPSAAVRAFLHAGSPRKSGAALYGSSPRAALGSVPGPECPLFHACSTLESLSGPSPCVYVKMCCSLCNTEHPSDGNFAAVSAHGRRGPNFAAGVAERAAKRRRGEQASSDGAAAAAHLDPPENPTEKRRKMPTVTTNALFKGMLASDPSALAATVSPAFH